MGGGIALWAANIDALAEKRPLYCFDLIGFGRSSRPKFSADAMETEQEFLESVEKWREKMGLERMILIGHSLGAFVSSAYAINYPSRVQHLILVDPWGFPERPPENERYPLPMWAKLAAAVFNPFNPLAVVRAVGPWGKVSSMYILFSIFTVSFCPNVYVSYKFTRTSVKNRFFQVWWVKTRIEFLEIFSPNNCPATSFQGLC